MLREVVSPQQQAAADDAARLRRACLALRQMDPELVEWTWPPPRGDGVYLNAAFHLTDAGRPLEQLAGTLRHLADQIDALAASPEEGPP